MLLLITFPNETMPFIEDGLSEEECIRAINKERNLDGNFRETVTLWTLTELSFMHGNVIRPEKRGRKRDITFLATRCFW